MGDRLQNSVNGYTAHVGRVIHEYEGLRYQKENLQFNEAVIHMDFSEDYNCKFAEETQAFKFGGSIQVSLHTVVTYLNDQNSPYTIRCFCTLSDCLDHSVHAIWAHLKPILKTLPESVNTIHFCSDSPSTQYRNKKMFTMLSQHFRDMFPNVHYFMCTCKRTADNLVSQSKDISDVATFFVADAARTTVLHMRELSCPACYGECPHYRCRQFTGQLKKELNVDEVYGTNSDYGNDLNETIKARDTNIDLSSIVIGTDLRVIVREKDVRVEYLVKYSKEYDLFKGNPNSVNHRCSVSDIIDVLNPKRKKTIL
ncbi:hypothetical protein PR048_004791 [Dryococelus australis]|uniref:Uncharacterized protein n=1 Tax=Dryococelus australis TaxID=614101 RepID=A0ABQ9I6F5_9NEOP|nr:hypothetical protein PR048_004791 [Dryococelus australis]